MRVALSGASCLGKTILATEISQEYNFIYVNEPIRKIFPLFKDIQIDPFSEKIHLGFFQGIMYATLLKDAVHYIDRNEKVIFDRSFLDALIYSIQYNILRPETALIYLRNTFELFPNLYDAIIPLYIKQSDIENYAKWIQSNSITDNVRKATVFKLFKTFDDLVYFYQTYQQYLFQMINIACEYVTVIPVALSVNNETGLPSFLERNKTVKNMIEVVMRNA